MTLQKGDPVTWFRTRPTPMPVPAVFVDAKGEKVRIRVQERDGSYRTTLVMRESVEKREVRV